MLRYKSSKLDFILLNKPKSEDNLPVKLNATVGTVEVVLSGGHPPIDYRVN